MTQVCRWESFDKHNGAKRQSIFQINVKRSNSIRQNNVQHRNQDSQNSGEVLFILAKEFLEPEEFLYNVQLLEKSFSSMFSRKSFLEATGCFFEVFNLKFMRIC